MSAPDHNKFAEVMAELLTLVIIALVFLTGLVLHALAHDAPSAPLPQAVLEETGAQIAGPPTLKLGDFLDPVTIAVLFLLLLMMLNPLQSCLYRLHPAWCIVFAAVFLAGIVAVFVIAAYDWPHITVFFLLSMLLYMLLGLAASIIALIVRRGEWKKRRYLDSPCYWWDILMVYTVFLLGTTVLIILEIALLPIVLVGFAARHIYIVRTLIRNRIADKKRSAPTEPAALAEEQGA